MEDLEKAWTEFSYVREYHPWRGGQNPAFTARDGKILDLKDGKEKGIANAVSEFSKHLPLLDLPEPIILAIVPGHAAKASNEESPMADVVKRLCSDQPEAFVEAIDLLLRHRTIEKLASGGTRSIETHLQSIRVSKIKGVRGSPVLLLDDVTTTGNSLAACRILLRKSGTSKVAAVALGRTTND